jgi:phosphoribosyl 1,2-cyclic phosphodiesterase
VISFGSGSSGNAFLVQSDETNLLVDAGVPIRRLRAGLEAAGVDDEALTAVLITHEHHDHVRTLPQLLRHHDFPVISTPGTIGALRGLAAFHSTMCTAGKTTRVDRIEITAISVSHDAAEPVGFFLDDGETRVAIFIDLGQADQRLAEPVEAAHLVVIEANHDGDILRRGRYPAYLKRRIAGSRGHLSNQDCSRFLADSLGSHTTDIWLAHLSANNNTPTLASDVITGELGTGTRVPRVRVLPRRGKDVVWDSSEVRSTPLQLRLPLG